MKKMLAALVLLGMTGCWYIEDSGQVRRSAGGRAFWSAMAPGAGQFMNEQPGKAVMLIALELVNYVTFDKDHDPDQRERLWAVMGMVHLWSATDAYDVATMLNETSPLGVIGRGEAMYEPVPPVMGITGPEGGWMPPVMFLDPFGQRVSASVAYRF